MSIDLEAIKARLNVAQQENDWESVNSDLVFKDVPALLAEVKRLNAELYPEKEIEEQRAKRWEAEKRLLQKTREQLASVTAERDALKKALDLMAEDFYDSSDDEIHAGFEGLVSDYIRMAQAPKGTGKEQNDG